MKKTDIDNYIDYIEDIQQELLNILIECINDKTGIIDDEIYKKLDNIDYKLEQIELLTKNEK